MNHLAKPLGSLWATLLLSACVTINIYFPSAEAKEAAEKIVEDILQTVPAVPPQAPGDRGAAPTEPGAGSALGALLRFLVPSAHAAQPDFSADSPEIRRIQASLKERTPALLPHYRSGAVGLTRDGLVALRDPGAVALRDRKRVQQLVADENAERNRLYGAIARANGHPEWEADIRGVFADTWIEKAQPGWWYQAAGGQWQKK